MWNITSNQTDKRGYINSATNSMLTQTMVYTDKDGNKWWMFDDLSTMPHTRNMAAIKISSLYTLGLSKTDLDIFFSGIKESLKSNDSEKYEKSYAYVLDFENKAKTATDAIKQMSSLVCVYYTINDEPIDSFDNNLQIKKMSLLEADVDMHAFFLNRQMDATERYTQHLNLISQIVSQPLKELSVLSE